MPTRYHKIGVIAGAIALLQTLTLPIVSAEYSRRLLLTWFVITPAVSIAVSIVLRTWLRQTLLKSGNVRSVVIAGVNEIRRKFALNMERHPNFGLEFQGIFGDRSRTTVIMSSRHPIMIRG